MAAPEIDPNPPRRGRNRRPLERIYRIHEAVRKGECPNCRELADELEVTQKTVQRDITFMRDELRLPIEYDASAHGYRYHEPVADFPLLEVGREELVALFLARHALEPLRGSRLERTLADCFRQISRAVEGRVSFSWAELEQAFSVRATGVVEPDIEQFGKVCGAVLESRELRFRYRKLGARGEVDRRLWPYHVGQVDGGWYVFGHDLDRGALRTFALQRMADIHVLPITFERPADWSLEQHLQGSLGIWAGDDRETTPHVVRVRLSGFAARLATERRWHPSQQVVSVRPRHREGEAVEVRMELNSLVDVTRWVLGWGAHVEVIGPKALRDSVRDALRGALDRYEPHDRCEPDSSA